MINEWEELDEHIAGLICYATQNKDVAKYSARIKNFIQKERIITKIKENQQWSLFFNSEKINKPEIAKIFDAIVIKYGSILSRFEA